MTTEKGQPCIKKQAINVRFKL